MSEEIKILKLVSGEELVAGVSETPEGKFVCQNPVALGVSHADRHLMMVPFMQYSKASESFEIDKSHVLIVTDPVKQIVDDYLSMTSKIMLPNRNVIASR